MTPEQIARQQIDAMLVASGWVVQDYKAVDFTAGRVIALREVPLTTGPCDYLLLVARKAVGAVEAKKQGTTRSAGRVTDRGGNVDKGFLVDHRSKASRKARQEVLADDLNYTPDDLDRSIVVPDQIRTILRTYRAAVPTELFPGRTLLPKTLIFAKDDSHAEDIVHICREVFGAGNDFYKKITYQAKHPATGKPVKGRDLIKEFCNSTMPRIGVTVDMIATGTDTKPLEVLIFLRDVRSRVYFDQMKGRGTRVVTPTDLQSVSGEDARAKTRFVIVDAVGKERLKDMDGPGNRFPFGLPRSDAANHLWIQLFHSSLKALLRKNEVYLKPE
jgi:type I site-specific restriction endonuclease